MCSLSDNVSIQVLTMCSLSDNVSIQVLTVCSLNDNVSIQVLSEELIVTIIVPRAKALGSNFLGD